MEKSAGFTLIELLVATTIIILLSLLIVPDLKSGQSNFALQRSAHKLAQDIRRTQEMAISVRDYPLPLPVPPEFEGGYGINFQISSPYSYKLFADSNNNKIFEVTEKIDEVDFEKGVEILSLSGAPLNIVFLPPDPQVFISSADPAEIILGLKDDPGRTKTIKVNKAGLIFIE